MMLYEKGKAVKWPYALSFHYDPAEISDDRETSWKPTETVSSTPILADGTPGVREVAFTVQFNDFGLGGVTLGPATKSTQVSILWLRQHQQPYAPKWTTPPVLVFTGLYTEVNPSGANVSQDEVNSKALFECVIKSTKIKAKVMAGKAVIDRNFLLRFPNVKPNEIVRAEVEIVLQEQPVSASALNQSIVDQFKLGVATGIRENQ